MLKKCKSEALKAVDFVVDVDVDVAVVLCCRCDNNVAANDKVRKEGVKSSCLNL